MQAPASLQDLDNNLLLHILRALPRASAPAARLCCRRWRNLFDAAALTSVTLHYANRNGTAALPEPQPLRMLQRCAQLSRVNLHSPEPPSAPLLACLAALAAIPRLEALCLQLHGCQLPLGHLSALTRLTRLHLLCESVSPRGAVPPADYLTPLGLLTGLRDVKVHGFFPIAHRRPETVPLLDLRPLTVLPVLERLTLTDSTAGTALAACTALTALDLSGAWGLRDILAVQALPRLVELRAAGLALHAEPWALPPALTRLDLSDAFSAAVDLLPPLPTSLRALSLRDCTELRQPGQLSTLVRLTELDLGSVYFDNFTVLRMLTCLEVLSLARAEYLLQEFDTSLSLDSLKGLARLAVLTLSGAMISDFEVVSGLTALRKLSLDGCCCAQGRYALDVSPLASLPALVQLNVTNASLTNMDQLRRVQALTVFDQLDDKSNHVFNTSAYFELDE